MGRIGKLVEIVPALIQGFQENERFFVHVLEVKLENKNYYEPHTHHKHSNHLLIG